MNILKFFFRKQYREKYPKHLDLKVNLVLEEEEKMYLELNSPPKEIYNIINE